MRRYIGEIGTGGGGRQAGDVEVVLDREGHAVQCTTRRWRQGVERGGAVAQDCVRNFGDPDAVRGDRPAPRDELPGHRLRCRAVRERPLQSRKIRERFIVVILGRGRPPYQIHFTIT